MKSNNKNQNDPRMMYRLIWRLAEVTATLEQVGKMLGKNHEAAVGAAAEVAEVRQEFGRVALYAGFDTVAASGAESRLRFLTLRDDDV